MSKIYSELEKFIVYLNVIIKIDFKNLKQIHLLDSEHFRLRPQPSSKRIIFKVKEKKFEENSP